MEPEQIQRRVRKAMIWGSAVLGVAAIALWMLMPPLYDVSAECDARSAAQHAAAGEWLVLRGAVVQSHPVSYNKTSDLSTITPGCGRGSADFLVVVQGDHSALKGAKDRLVVAPADVGDAGGLNRSGPGLPRLTGEFEARSHWWPAAAQAIGPLGILAALGLILAPGTTAWWGLAGAALIGTCMGHIAAQDDQWKLLLWMGAPFSALPAFFVQPKQRWWVTLLLVVAALAIYGAVSYWTHTEFTTAYPLVPPASAA